MYFIDENEHKIDVKEVKDGYILKCLDCGFTQFMLEEDFIRGVEEDIIDVICDDPEDDSDEMCQCDYCKGFRDGIEASMDTIDELDSLEDENECFVDDIRCELFAINEEMVSLRDEGMYEEYSHMANAYAMLYRLIM